MSRPNSTSTGSESGGSSPTDTGATNRQRSETVVRSSSSDPTIRWYEPGDVEQFLTLYETVWGTQKGPAWFDWRFLENPAASGVEMVLAETDGQLVGAEPVMPYRLRAGDRTVAARQPVDWIVHPEYRRMGIFSSMTERLVAGLSEDASLLFNFPNEALRPGIERYGWRMIDTVGARYRVQDPRAALEMGPSSTSVAVSKRAARLGSPLVRRGLGLLDRVGSPSDAVTVERARGVPAGTVSSLYAENVPEQMHVPRNRAFLEWRFANTRWEVETYVANRDSDVVATGIVATESIDGHDLVRLLDVQPMTTVAGDADAFESMLAALVEAHADAAVLKLPTGLYPGVCRRHGFVCDDGFLFSRLSATTYHAVRPLEGDSISDAGDAEDSSIAGGSGDVAPWTATIETDGRSFDLGDSADWLLAPGDMDVA